MDQKRAAGIPARAAVRVELGKLVPELVPELVQDSVQDLTQVEGEPFYLVHNRSTNQRMEDTRCALLGGSTELLAHHDQLLCRAGHKRRFFRKLLNY